MRRRTLVFGLGLMLLVGGILAYQFSGSDMLKDTERETHAAVLARIRLGTEMSRAAAIMEREGFKCTKIYTHFSLWCDRERMIGPFVWRRWQVLFVDTGGVATDVAVAVSLTGP
jgi:hypothetical protein